jgi:hypothetical protein
MQRTAKAKAKELDKMYQEHQKVWLPNYDTAGDLMLI